MSTNYVEIRGAAPEPEPWTPHFMVYVDGNPLTVDGTPVRLAEVDFMPDFPNHFPTNNTPESDAFVMTHSATGGRGKVPAAALGASKEFEFIGQLYGTFSSRPWRPHPNKTLFVSYVFAYVAEALDVDLTVRGTVNGTTQFTVVIAAGQLTGEAILATPVTITSANALIIDCTATSATSGRDLIVAIQ